MEFTGATVEEAVRAGLNALGISRSEAVIVVIDEGAKGLFGLGAKQAVVRISTLTAGTQPAPGQPPAATTDEYDDDDDDEDDDYEEDDVDDEEDDLEDEEEEEDVFGDDDEPDESEVPGELDADEDEEDDQEDEEDESGPENKDEIIDVTRSTVLELLDKMHVRADVRAKMMPYDSHSKRSAVAVDISGDDLSILIGRKAETLEALEYITRLIVGKELNDAIIVNIDVQGYKKRKEQRLRRIAQSVARQAVDTGRRQYLEPMSAADRRIIHMELRNHPEVYTESVGEGERRKVTINPRV